MYELKIVGDKVFLFPAFNAPLVSSLSHELNDLISQPLASSELAEVRKNAARQKTCSANSPSTMQ